MPYVIVADDAFPLQTNIMKPFAFRNQNESERIFNYRLSRARRIIEIVFGIMSARFRILQKNIELGPEKAKIIVSAICVLHNFLIDRSRQNYMPANSIDSEIIQNGIVVNGSWRNETNQLESLEPVDSDTCDSAKEIRNELMDYFLKEGQVPWQYKFI